MTKVTVMAGPCKFSTEIKATLSDFSDISLDINSECPHFQELSNELKEVDAFDELGMSRTPGIVKETVEKYAKHKTCPVCVGILKAIEVEANLALPVNPEITIEKE